MIEVHDDNTSKCPICGYMFESGPFFQTHVASHAKEMQDELLSRERPKYTCSLCNTTFDFDDRQTEQIRAHNLWHHEDAIRQRQAAEALEKKQKEKWDKLYALKHPLVVVDESPVESEQPKSESKLTRKLNEKPRRPIVENIPEQDPLTLSETVTNYWRRFVAWIRSGR